MGYPSNELANVVDYETERVINVFSFLFYGLLTSIYFIRTEEKFQIQLSAQKNEIDNLLKILVHDISTPLTVMNFTLIKVKMNNWTNIEEAHQTLTRCFTNIHLLLNQVKSLSALRDGKTYIQMMPFKLNETLHEVQTDLQTALVKKQIKLVINAQHQSEYLYGDSNVFRQVILTNIITNAIKFSEPEGQIDLTTEDCDEFVSIRIRDHGIGMPTHIRKNLFNAHYQTHRKGTSGEGGTGFGMPLVYEFTQKLQGTIEVESSEADTEQSKRGTTFHLKFRIAKPEVKAKISA
jgi:signal transduction histidine kinase